MRSTSVNGKKYESLVGSRAQVWHGTCYKTSGGLTKHHLMMNKAGHIVSKSKHHTAKKEKRLLKAGYGTQKGKFGFVRIGKSMKRSRKSGRSKKMRGGNVNIPLSPTHYDGQGVGTSGVDLQFIAGQGN